MRFYVNLVERDPANPGWKHGLGSIHSAVGFLRERQANYLDAAKEAVEAERLLRELSESDPDAASWKVSHSTARIVLGRLLQTLAQSIESPEEKVDCPLKAFSQFGSARTTLQELVTRDSENTIWLNGFGWIQRLTGGAVEALADLVDAGYKVDADWSTADLRKLALQCYVQSGRIAAQLSAMSPDEFDLKRDISLSMTRAGILSEKLGMAGEALDFYLAALLPSRQLHDLDPTNEAWAEALSVVNAAIHRLEERPGESIALVH